MCDITKCSSAQAFGYRSNGADVTKAGVVIPCTKFQKPSCIIPRSPQPAPTPKALETSLYAGPGARCDQLTCQPGYVCGAQQKCVRQVRFFVDAAGADHVLPFVGANPLIGYDSETVNKNDEGEWYHDGPCSDVFLRVRSNGGGQTGVSARIRTFPLSAGETFRTVVKSDGVYGQSELTGTVVKNPSSEAFRTDPDYDFEQNGWLPVKNQPALTQQLRQKIDNTVDAWTMEEGQVQAAEYWYRIQLPFCL